MKNLLIALTILAPAIAQAASPEDSYFKARDAYIEKITADYDAQADDEFVSKQQQAALDDLERQLQKIIGPSTIKDVPAQAKISLDTLYKRDEGFGLLDGLAYASADEKTRVVVSTQTLLKDWIKAHKNWWDGLENVPQSVAEAVTSTAFYTQAISTDSQIVRYAEIPVAKPAAAEHVYAMLALHTQDIGPGTPDGIVLSLVRGNRIYIVSAPTAATITPIAACDAIWTAYRQQEDKANEASLEAQRKGEKPAEWSEKPREDASNSFLRCYQEQAKSQLFFAALKQQAQALVDGLPER